MIEDKFAVIGDEYLPTMFKLCGADTFFVSDAKDTRETMLKVIEEYKLIVIFSEYARLVSDIIDDASSAYPLIVVLPSSKIDNYALEKLRESTKQILSLKLNFD